MNDVKSLSAKISEAAQNIVTCDVGSEFIALSIKFLDLRPKQTRQFGPP
jgi:hypothetical protein